MALAPINISVTDPTKTNNYISYKVTSGTTRDGFAGGSFTVDRRYNDFAWLTGQLSKEFPGAIVPPLPEKQSMGRFSSEFIDARRRALEKFLQRTATHHELGTSPALMHFLQSDESGMEAYAADFKAKMKASGGTSWLEGSLTALTGSKPDLEKSAADLKIEEVSAYISQLEKQMTNITKHAESLIKRNRELSKAMFEFGQSFTWLGQSEGDAVGSALVEMGSTAESLSNNAQSHAEGETLKFVEPMEEYARMLASIKLAMKQRQQNKVHYINCIVDLESKQASYQKLLGVAGKEAQATAKEQAVVNAQQAADASKVEFERVSERLLTEFDLFKNQKAADVKEIILSFAQLEMDYSKRCEELWGKLVPRIESIVVDSPDDMRSALHAKAQQNATRYSSTLVDDGSAADTGDGSGAGDDNSNNQETVAWKSNFQETIVDDDDDDVEDVEGV